MDTPENSTRVIDESNCQVPFVENNTKRDSAIQEDNEIQNVPTHSSSDNIFNVPLQTPREYENQLVINEDISTADQINVSSLSMESLVEDKGSVDAQSNQHVAAEGITLVQVNSSELETISIDSGSVEQLIATTLSEVISCENDTVTTACAIQSAPDNINSINDLSCSLVESCIDARGDSEVNVSLKMEGNSLDSNNSELDESLPSFIGEIDESVSLPPAEPLILEENSSSHSVPDEDKEIVTRKLVVNENIIDDIVNNKTIDKNMTKGETIHEDSTVNVTNTDNEKSSDNVNNIDNKSLTENISLNEIVPENVTLNEIELTEAPQTEIITSESNIHYTILPPGENSVYQEDGTLVVEYPLDTTGISHNQTSNVNEFIETHKIGITESTISGEHEVVQIVENLNEANFIEMIETPEDGSISTEIVTPEAALEKKHSTESSAKEKNQINSEVVQPKRKGRRPIEGIPPHMVGHPIDKPDQDVVNGKALKPRLGVKIPYRKLASQIVSTSELQNHIVERARLKEEARTESDKTNLFTKKLTHRLAQSLSGLTNRDSLERKGNKAENKKGAEDIHIIENILTVIPSRTNENATEQQPTNPIEFVEQIVNEDTGMLENVSEKLGEREVTVSSCESIENAEIIFAGNMKNSTNIESNSDLIAILEGDGDESSPIMSVPNVVEIVDTSENASEIKAIEKEISLTEQKSSLPTVPQVKEKKFFKSRDSRISDVSKDKIKESITKVRPNLINEISKTKISSVKNEEAIKTNIFDIESTSVLKGAAKSVELKKVPLNDHEKASDFKKKSTATVIEVEPQLKPAMVLKTYTRKRKSNDVSTPEPPKKPLLMPSSSTNQPDVKIDCVTPIPPNVYVTKSSRVIKRKVIWDPDEAMPSVRNQSKILSKIEASVKTATPTKITGSQKLTTVKTVEKKISEKEKHVDQPKITKSNEKKVPNTSTLNENEDIVEKQTIKKAEKQEITKKPIVKNPIPDKPIPQRKVIITSSMKISPGKSPKKSTKRLSEIDKLLMDEGAVNMLYDINNSDDQKRRVSGRSGNTPTDKVQTQKELLNRTQEIKNELTQGSSVITSTPKILRKKEGPPSVKKDKDAKELSTISRKMSKDSTKSSTHSAPPSPAEASRIIRRHSSSSFSSDEGLVQDESMDSTSEQVDEKQNKKKEVPVEKSSTIVDENPREEQNKGKITKKRIAPPTQEALPKKRLKKDEPILPNGEPSKPTEIVIKSEPGIVTGALMTDPTKAFTVIKMNKHYCINLTYSGNESYLTVQLLKDLTVTLKELERTRNCSVVSINSQCSTFCLGIDYKQLVESDDELRSKKIKELSLGIRDFLKCLLNFSKIIVAGVKGDCIGLGVTMLPLFDMVVATDTASFSTPYAKVGCPPEAGFLLSIPYHSNHALASELLYTAQKMNADEAQRRGLVTKLFWPEKFDSEFRALLSHISNLSKPALMVTKKQLRQAYNNTENEIINNSKLLMKFWANEECQNNFMNYDALTFMDQ